jgi:hypothetical protein
MQRQRSTATEVIIALFPLIRLLMVPALLILVGLGAGGIRHHGHPFSLSGSNAPVRMK